MKPIVAKLGWIGAAVLLLMSHTGWTGAMQPAPVRYFDLVVDDPRQRLYASNSSSGSIDVILMSTLEVVATINVGLEPKGIDISPDGDELAVALSGQREIAFIDLNTLSVISRVTPLGMSGPNIPYDVLYGRAGRMYSVGNPGSSGSDYIHVFDTTTKVEVGRSAEIVSGAPRLAITADYNTLYVAEVSLSPRGIYRFDITTDIPVRTGAAHGAARVETICVMPDGRLFSSYGQVWSADLSTLLADVPLAGNEIECADSSQRVYISSYITHINPLMGDSAWLYALDANNYSRVWDISLSSDVGVVRIDESETTLYISTSNGIRTLGADIKPRAFFPIIGGRSIPGIHGRVTINGAPAAGERLELRFFDGFTWSTLRSIDTDINGKYAFLDVPALESGQRYYVRYANRIGVANRLLFWGTRELTSYMQGESVDIGDFDIADVALTAPPAGVTVTLPSAFRWTPRPATPTDSYEFNLYDAASLEPYFFVEVGYLDSYTLNSLPRGFDPGKSYVWSVWVYSPDGGVGISREIRPVTFANRGTQIALPSAHPKGKSWRLIDDPPDW